MPVALPDHGRPDPSVVSGPLQPVRSPQSGSRMEESTQSTTLRSSVADTTRNTAQATSQAAAIDSGPAPQVKKDAPGGPKQLNKRSADYVLRSGLAGGLAGCAVSFLLFLCFI